MLMVDELMVLEESILWNTVNNFGAISFENRFADVGES